MKKGKGDFFDQFGPDARAILNAILEKYAEHGAGEFVLRNVLEVPPISDFGSLSEIVRRFGGTDKLLAAVEGLQECLYTA